MVAAPGAAPDGAGRGPWFSGEKREECWDVYGMLNGLWIWFGWFGWRWDDLGMICDDFRMIFGTICRRNVDFTRGGV